MMRLGFNLIGTACKCHGTVTAVSTSSRTKRLVREPALHYTLVNVNVNNCSMEYPELPGGKS
jgi:hypothetical protein